MARTKTRDGAIKKGAIRKDGRIDRPDRLFYSLEAAFKGCTSNPSDVKELVPELFYNPDVLQNITVTLSVEVGRAMIKIRDLMRLTQGSVVELDHIAGEPLDLLVNKTVVAQGEVVLVNDRYGIRLTRVVPASERMKNL